MPMIAVTTVPMTKVAAGCVQLTANARRSKGGPEIAPEQRSRSIVIPELEVHCEKKYQQLILDALYSTGTELLREFWKESDPKELDAALFSQDALLAYYARVSESKRLSGEAIEEWYKSSNVRERMMAQGGVKLTEAVKLRFMNLAAPEPKYTEEKALAAMLALEADADSEMGRMLIAKLQRIVEKLRSEQAAAAEVAPF